MNKNETYDFIGELAIALYSKKIQISLSALNTILKDKGNEYGNNRGLGAGVSAAWRHWKKKTLLYITLLLIHSETKMVKFLGNKTPNKSF